MRCDWNALGSPEEVYFFMLSRQSQEASESVIPQAVCVCLQEQRASMTPTDNRGTPCYFSSILLATARNVQIEETAVRLVASDASTTPMALEDLTSELSERLPRSGCSAMTNEGSRQEILRFYGRPTSSSSKSQNRLRQPF